MTKQEKIREGFAKEICRLDRSWWEKLTDADKEYYRDKADDYSEHLHSQGVVIKVEREMPKDKDYTDTRECFNTKEEGHAFDTGYFTAKQDMLKVGYVKVEPLMGVVDE